MSRIVFPGDPDYDRPNPARDWHYGILFASIVVIFVTIGIYVIAPQLSTKIMLLVSIITFIVALLTTPDDPRYP